MKNSIVTLLTAAMVAVSAPAFPVEHQHDASQNKMDAQCVKECDMLLRDCSLEVDSIQLRIKKIQVEINEKGATTYTLEELKTLKNKLKEANETLRVLQTPR